MGKFLSDMVELGLEALVEIPASKKKILKAKETLQRLVVDNEEMDIDEFLEMYDTRIHDFDSKQDDIKILKQIDFEGVYIIHNCTKDICLVGKSQKVLRKVDRQFRGYENEDVYADYQNGDTFKIRIIDFERSDYENIDELVKDMTNEYGIYTFEKEVEVECKVSQKDKKGNAITLCICFGIMILLMCFSLFMAYWYSTPKAGEVKVTVDPKNYIGVNYEEVEEKFEDMGFTNVKSVPKEDLITGWINKEGETDKITINNDSFKKDEIFSEDAEVVITYHSFKEK